MKRRMVISANDIHRSPTEHAATDKLDLIAWHERALSVVGGGQEERIVFQSPTSCLTVLVASHTGPPFAWSRQRKRALRG